MGDDEELFIAAGVFLHQAVAKYLKGYLLSKGWKLVRPHHLGNLIDALASYENDFAEFKDMCLALTKFYLDNRYTLKPPESVQQVDLERLAADSQALIDRIRRRATPTTHDQRE